MRLGEMLIRDGRLSEGDLDRVMTRQASEGGRLGSLLVSEGLIDVETLTVYLGLELGIPIATGATFERCKRSAVRLLSPEQASRFRCIPVVIQGQTLIVAVDDPHDMQTLDQIAHVTGYRVIPRVAPEIRIYYYLDRFYGVPTPRRFAELGDMRGSVQPSEQHQGLPAPPLPGLPPRVADPTAAPSPAPPLRAKRSSKPPPVPPTAIPMPISDVETGPHEALELDAADLVEELEADDAELADTAPRAEITPVPADRPATVDEEEQRPEPLGAEAAREIISTTDYRGDIADAVLGHASAIFDTAVLLLVRSNMAFGWKGFGPGLDTDRIETLLVPLEVQSMFQVALNNDDGEHCFRGRPFGSPLHNHWFKVLRAVAPKTSFVTVCSIGSRAVNLLYGHREDGEDLSDSDMEELKAVMRAAGDGYVRLISKSKKEHRAATMNPDLGMADARDDDDATPAE